MPLLKYNQYHVKSVSKAMDVMNCFTPEYPELTLVEISRKVKMSKATVFRILATLTSGEMLEQDPESGKYSVGSKTYYLANIYSSTNHLIKAAQPVLRTINDLTSESVILSVRDGANSVRIMKEEPKYAFQFSIYVGTSASLYSSATGKALLSELAETEIDKLYPYETLRPVTIKTITTRSELKLELEEIRKTGIAFDKEGSYEGVEGIGSLIRDASGTAVAAMAIAVPIFRIDNSKRKRLCILLKLGCSLASKHMGYEDMSNPVRDMQEIISWWQQS